MKQTMLALALVLSAFSTKVIAQHQINLQAGVATHAVPSTIWSIDFADQGHVYSSLTGTEGSTIQMPVYNIGYQFALGGRWHIGADFSFMKGSGPFNQGGVHAQTLPNGSVVMVELAGDHDLAVSRTDLIAYFNLLNPDRWANLLVGTGLSYSTHLHEHPSFWLVDVSAQGLITFPLKESIQESDRSIGFPVVVQAQLPLGKHFQIVAGAKGGWYKNNDVNFGFTAGVGYRW